MSHHLDTFLPHAKKLLGLNVILCYRRGQIRIPISDNPVQVTVENYQQNRYRYRQKLPR